MDGSGSLVTPVPAIAVENLSRTVGGICALRQVSFAIMPGQSLAVVGSSGSGKSTLLNLLAGFDAPTTGQITVAGHCLASLRPADIDAFRVRHLGFVHQHHRLIADLTLVDNVALPARLAGLPKKTARVKAFDLLARVGLSHRAMSLPGVLSGGERQRGGIARALVNAPRILLADEPTGNLDPETADGVWTLMERVTHEVGAILVAATHAPHLAARLARIIRLA